MRLSQIIKMQLKMRLSEKLIFLLKRLRDIRNGFWPVWLGYGVLAIKTRKVQTFQEKMLYKIAFDRNPLLPILADKVSAREYVSDLVGSQYLTTLYGVYEYGREIPKQDLPHNFAIKASHGSGGVLLVSENADELKMLPARVTSNSWGRYLIHPDSLNWDDAILLMDHWTSNTFWNSPGHFPEWAYKGISPRIIVEELLVFENAIPQDYRFFIFEGNCEYIELDCRWKNLSTKTLFDRNWKQIEVTRNFPGQPPFPAAVPIPSKPKCLVEMIEIAEILARDTDHLRVDLYLLGNRIVFGELTNYHTSGLQTFRPKEFNTEFAKNWHPQMHYSRSGIGIR